ncbi:DUF2065 domain-containing protein [Arenibacterium sp. CAU 1754]
MAFILLALGLLLIVEGLAYALAPSLVERMLQMLAELPLPARRQVGLIAVATGIILLWMADLIGL